MRQFLRCSLFNSCYYCCSCSNSKHLLFLYTFRKELRANFAIFLSFQCSACHWTDIKSHKSMSLSLCVCLSEILIVHDSDRSFCPIFLKFGPWVTHLTTKTKFDGRLHRSSKRAYASIYFRFSSLLGLCPR